MLSRGDETEKPTGVGDFVLPQLTAVAFWTNSFSLWTSTPWWRYDKSVKGMITIVWVTMRNSSYSDKAMCLLLDIYNHIPVSQLLCDICINISFFFQKHKLWPKGNNSIWLGSDNQQMSQPSSNPGPPNSQYQDSSLLPPSFLLRNWKDLVGWPQRMLSLLTPHALWKHLSLLTVCCWI